MFEKKGSEEMTYRYDFNSVEYHGTIAQLEMAYEEKPSIFLAELIKSLKENARCIEESLPYCE